MDISSYITAGNVAKGIGFSLLKKSDTINSFVNWITGGSVNRSTLARHFLTLAINVGMDFAIQNKSLGDRSAEIVPLAKQILIDNSRDERTQALEELLQKLLSPGDLEKLSSENKSSLVSIASELTGDNLFEKLLTTTVKQHGWEPLETYLHNAMGASVLGGTAKSFITGVLKHAIVDDAKFDRSDSEHFKAAAVGVKTFLDGGDAKAAVLAHSSVSSVVRSILQESSDRPSMAKALFQVVSEVGPRIATERGVISPSAAQAISPLKMALVDGDRKEAAGAIQDLAKLIAPSIAQYVPQMIANSLPNRIVGTTGNHVVPKVLAAIVKDSGWKPLEDYLRQQMGGEELADVVVELVKEILQHEFIDNDRYQSDNNELVKTLSVAGKAFLEGKDVTQAVMAYAPKTGWAMWAAEKGYSLSSSTFQSGKNIVYGGFDLTQQLLGRTPVEVDAKQFYQQAIQDGVGTFVINDQLSPWQFADRLLLRATENGLPEAFSELSKSLDEAKLISAQQYERLKKVLDELAPEQCLPFQNGTAQISVAHYWGGKLTTASIQAHDDVMLPGEKMHALSQAYQNIRAHYATRDSGGYSALGAAFVSQVGTLKLDLPPEAYTYKDTVAESANGSWNYAKSWFGYDSGLSGSDLKTFRQLYNACGGNAGVMSEVSKVLNMEMGHSLVAEPIFEAFGVAGQPDVLNINGENVRVEQASTPDIQFSVRRSEHGGVEVDISAEWTIASYGEQTSGLRVPTGTQASVARAKGTLIVVPSTDGASTPHVGFVHNGVSFDLHNQVSFETGQALSQVLAMAVA